MLQLVQDGISSNKPGVVTTAAANLVEEMSNIEQVLTKLMERFEVKSERLWLWHFTTKP